MIQKIILLSIVIVLGLSIAACRKQSPTESYKGLYAAVKSKDTESIKKWMTKSTLGFAEMVSKQQNTPIEKVFENGFTATTFAASLPEMRDERIKDNMGALEVWNSKDQRWEDLPFIKEEDGWKLAIGELFAGTYQKPAPGQAEKQAEEANKMSNNIIQAPAGNLNANGNANFKIPKVGKNPVPMPPASNKPSLKANTNTLNPR